MTAGTTTLKIMSRGKERTYLLHIPTAYDPTKPTSLVLAFHGMSDKAPDFFKMNRSRQAKRTNATSSGSFRRDWESSRAGTRATAVASRSCSRSMMSALCAT
jgi:hypothetical protein